MSGYITRSIEKKLISIIDVFPVIMITGPRQVGKTTLLNHLTLSSNKNINYVSLDNMLIRTKANEDPELFLKSYSTPLIIDEFQYAPQLLSYIKIKVDEEIKNSLFERKKPVETLYYLTGLQVFETMNDVSESLAGRVGILDLYSFSNREINNLDEELFIPDIDLIKKRKRTNNDSIKKLFERIFNGSYPEIINNNGKNAKRYLYYYRDQNQKEIDLIINYDNTIYPIEIKKSANPGVSAIKNFEVVKKFGINVGNGIVLCMMNDILAIDENNYYVPIDYI